MSDIGLGCMGMTGFYGAADEQEAIATIHRALELGVNLLDTADIYGPFTNEELVGKAIKRTVRPSSSVGLGRTCRYRPGGGPYLTSTSPLTFS